uniref:Uncharacterized protein AlNc14C604G12231 n=1 Tax=Albugo laibachii Nc14 TaxID=890382 RepID=F0X1E0_9STRA|nr:hypothetical protein PITG_01701 [Albugo laibachii Nc14]|eukprot:CCA27618.1 hypothetical protein PITG_01701 [Albugo laibachii Nc14]
MVLPTKARLRSEKHLANVKKRGNVSQANKGERTFPIGPVLLGFFIFVIVGSSIMQILRAAQSAM